VWLLADAGDCDVGCGAWWRLAAGRMWLECPDWAQLVVFACLSYLGLSVVVEASNLGHPTPSRESAEYRQVLAQVGLMEQK